MPLDSGLKSPLGMRVPHFVQHGIASRVADIAYVVEAE